MPVARRPTRSRPQPHGSRRSHRRQAFPFRTGPARTSERGSRKPPLAVPVGSLATRRSSRQRIPRTPLRVNAHRSASASLAPPPKICSDPGRTVRPLHGRWGAALRKKNPQKKTGARGRGAHRAASAQGSRSSGPPKVSGSTTVQKTEPWMDGPTGQASSWAVSSATVSGNWSARFSFSPSSL